MTKSNITEYDNTAANNTDVQDVPLGESAMFPSHVNNAFREIMADLADINDGTVAMTSPSFASASVTGNFTVDTDTLHVDSTNNRVGINDATPSEELDINGDGSDVRIRMYDGAGASVGRIEHSGANFDISNTATSTATMTFTTGSGSGTERMRIDSSGNVGIGTASPSQALTVNGAGARIYLTGANEDIDMDGSANGQIQIDGNGYTGGIALNGTAMNIYHNSSGRSIIFGTNETERLRIENSGQIQVRTYQSTATVPQIGMRVTSSSTTYNTGFNTIPQSLGNGMGMIIGGYAVINMRWGYSGGHFAPAMNYSGSGDAMNLGTSSLRWKQVYAYNTSISSSDENLKSQIASLTDAEITAARAISKLFKTYKWTGKVEEEGDKARTHTGVVAQHVQQALASAGLEPFQYSFLCKDTYWQRTVEHPAVEAVEGQEAVYDDDGNIVTEAVEAVEQQYAWKENQTFVDGDDIPEDATEVTLLAIRYEELFAFVSAATEQRLTDIETRLTALETE